ncbi:S41 family peptidase [candidate division TA06 bacterium]|nr:S41 family peptidase [candidate division TA06 bacterium]
MITKRKLFTLIAGIAVFSMVAGGMFALYAQSQLTDDVVRSLAMFREAYYKIYSNYVVTPDPQKLIYGAIKGMLESLDPHSNFLNPKAFNDLKVSTEGSFGGLGIQIDIRDSWLTVIAPMAGTPASRLGIQAGDRIVKIDNISTRGITTDGAISKLRGRPGTKVTIAIQREGVDQPMDFEITRELIEIKSIPYYGLIKNKTGYIWLANFMSKKTGDDLATAIKDLENQGMKQLILDLRGNPGGQLNEAVDVSSDFLKDSSLVVFTKGRMPRSNMTYNAYKQNYDNLGQPLYGPKKGSMVVLINQGSASASEIVAGALQDWDRALILGQTSFGKGSVQNIVELNDSIAYKLTTAKYYTPSGRCIHRDNSAWQSGELDSLEEDSTAPKEKFTTLGGLKRTVYGGGGIIPDVKVDLPLLKKLESNLERKTLFFKFAVKYTVTRKDLPQTLEVDAPMLAEFKKLLADEKFEYTEQDFKESEAYIKKGIKRELLSKLYGDKAMTAFLLEGDAQVQKAVELLEQHKDLNKLLQTGQNK